MDNNIKWKDLRALQREIWKRADWNYLCKIIVYDPMRDRPIVKINRKYILFFPKNPIRACPTIEDIFRNFIVSYIYKKFSWLNRMTDALHGIRGGN